ncbi:argininosuccinate lyase [Commensalibacter sp. M0270]|nr:argininosuccinate lyase [Commensalibacter sp. M0265]MBH9976860.1 argininosuccinate lyase [Commensalibacter sp. M0266]MBH9992203.1 argininosuccinate lyase [Commensalibacter sp. M0270]MBI0046036.1 argininosuccinate lyase [Commensalibacter sp. M0267]MBI0055705.1 argininosuccinate lyase [Commensalibacter sp. M0268]
MEQINASIGFDKNLWKQDIQGSIAHAEMLAKQKIISETDKNSIHQGLREIEREIQSGQFEFSRALEDIHMNIEARLAERIGEAGKRLHTARSRNDQVATDFRLWIRQNIDELIPIINHLMLTLASRALEYAETAMPGFTHLQSAQPVTFGHHLLAYTEMLNRDRGRLIDTRRRLNENPLGAAALAGTSFPIDRQLTSKLLGFDRPMANSLDAVSDRDFALEYLSALSIMSIHLSRMAEELVIWCSPPFSFIQLSDAYTTGSSIMPQKRNPDAAELVRAKVGRISGALTGLLTVMKGLPLAYAKDMQEDKEQVFAATETIILCLAACSGMIADLKANQDNMAYWAGSGFSTATDLADWLVKELKLPFRTAHHVTGKIVSYAETHNLALENVPLQKMQEIEPLINNDIYSVLGVQSSLASRTSEGGTAPKNVRKSAKIWIDKLKDMS